MSLYDLIEDLPNDRERRAIREFRRCVVIAGPGSGKTYRLSLKIAYLLGQEIKSLHSIACITYMNDAVREIEDRVSSLGFEDENRLFIGTVHKFCITAIILPFMAMFLPNWPRVLRIADEEQQIRLIEDTATRLRILLSENDEERNRQLRRMRDQIHNSRIDELLGKVSVLDSTVQLRDTYVDVLQENEVVDFDSIGIEACRLVIDQPVVRNYLAARYPWLIIDEYQDLGVVFNSLIKHLITKTNISFFVVGDMNQSIMGFQGADPRFLEELARLEDVELVRISVTRRCWSHIADLANLLLPQDSTSIVTTNMAQAGQKVRHHLCSEGLEEQIRCIIAEVRRLNQELNIPFGNIAVLCRNQETLRQIAHSLSHEDISYSGDKDGRYPRQPLTRWLEDLAIWAQHGWKTKKPKFQRIFREYYRFLRILNESAISNLTELEIQSRFFQAIWLSGQEKTLVSDWLYTLSAELYLDKIAGVLFQTEPHNANAFWEFSEITMQGNQLGHMTVADLALCGRSEQSIFLSTLHSSKGLEFDAVIIPDLEEGRLPDFRAETSEQIAEERRLLYVGVTRAKKELLLLYSGHYSNRWGRIFSDGPSRFLSEMKLI